MPDSNSTTMMLGTAMSQEVSAASMVESSASRVLTRSETSDMRESISVGSRPSLFALAISPEALFRSALSASISATLANEFTEAVGEVHTGALIELGLLLFAFLINGAAVALVQLGALGRIQEVLDLRTETACDAEIATSIRAADTGTGLTSAPSTSQRSPIRTGEKIPGSA